MIPSSDPRVWDLLLPQLYIQVPQQSELPDFQTIPPPIYSLANTKNEMHSYDPFAVNAAIAA